MIRALCATTGKVLVGQDAVRALTNHTATRIVEERKLEMASTRHR